MAAFRNPISLKKKKKKRQKPEKCEDFALLNKSSKLIFFLNSYRFIQYNPESMFTSKLITIVSIYWELPS